MLRARPACIVAALLLAACGAPDPEPPMTENFEEIDRDQNDIIDQPEFVAAFGRFDLDGDGVIATAENPALVYEADGNRDGVVTREEFANIDLARLEADFDVDGRISRNELERYELIRRDEVTTRRQADLGVGRLPPEARWIQFRF